VGVEQIDIERIFSSFDRWIKELKGVKLLNVQSLNPNQKK